MSDDAKDKQTEPPYEPDLSEVPNFGALREWFDKLESWCKAAAETLEKRDDENDELKGQLEELESEEGAAKHRLEEIEEMVADVGRGVRTVDELKDLVERG